MTLSRLIPILALALACDCAVSMADETAAETVLSGTETRSGYVVGRTFSARPVTYTVVGDLAVLEGDIVLGTVAEMEALAAQIELEKALRAMPDDHDLGYWSSRSMQRLRVRIRSNVDAKPSRRWPNGIVPYVIDSDLPDHVRVTDAMKHWSDKTNIQFVPRTKSHKNYVYYTAAVDGCFTNFIGMKPNGQTISVGPKCTDGNVIHEIGHAIGLWHEHTREDRDSHITIDLDNIKDEDKPQFEQKRAESDDTGDYDYGSIMHYGPKAFAKDDTKTTISPKISGVTIGQRDAISAGDISAVNGIYP